MKAFYAMMAALLLAIPCSLTAKKKTTSNMRVGVILSDWKNIEKSFSELKEHGFTCCQMGYGGSGMDEAYCKRLKEAKEKYGVTVTALIGIPGHCEWNFLGGPSTIGLVPAEGREAKVKVYKQIIDVCAMAGIPALHSHFGFIPEEPRSPVYLSFIEVMKDIATYAKERGVNIYFETGQETPITLIRAIKDVGTGNLFVNCDVANLMLYGKANPIDAVKLFGPYLKELHAKDGTYPSIDNPNHLGREVPIPQGDVNFPALIKQLKAQGFEGALTIEYELSNRTYDYLVKTRLYLEKLIKKM